MVAEEIRELMDRLRERVGEECIEEMGSGRGARTWNVDGCKVKASGCVMKVRFDCCADERLSGEKGGCDLVLVFEDKVCIVECTSGRLGNLDARRKAKQVKTCLEALRKLSQACDERKRIRSVIYHNGADPTALKRIRIELKGLAPKFLKCEKEVLE